MRHFSGKRPLQALRSPCCNYTQGIALAAPRAFAVFRAAFATSERGLMADIELRFHKDMLVLSAPGLAFSLANQGVDMETEAEYMSLVEPETMRDALRLESMAARSAWLPRPIFVRRAWRTSAWRTALENLHRRLFLMRARMRRSMCCAKLARAGFRSMPRRRCR